MSMFSWLFGGGDTDKAAEMGRQMAQEIARGNPPMWGGALSKTQAQLENEMREQGYSERGIEEFTNEFFETYIEESGQQERYSSWLESL